MRLAAFSCSSFSCKGLAAVRLAPSCMGWFSSKPQGCSTFSSKLQRLKDAVAPLHSQLRVGCICDAVPVPITAAKETPLRGRAQPFGFHSFFHFRSLLFTIPLKAARSRPFAAQGSKLQKGLQAAYVGLAPSSHLWVGYICDAVPADFRCRRPYRPGRGLHPRSLSRSSFSFTIICFTIQPKATRFSPTGSKLHSLA